MTRFWFSDHHDSYYYPLQQQIADQLHDHTPSFLNLRIFKKGHGNEVASFLVIYANLRNGQH
jgi:hypothetical protein